jgi:hypothetical protein
MWIKRKHSLGAAFMLARECGPVPMFDGTRVWGVDDAFFKRLYGEERIGVLPNLHREQMHRLIGRSESGYGRSQTTYAGRLASAVALREVLDGSNKETASARAKEFILSLKEVIPEADIDPAVDPQTDLVFERVRPLATPT